MHLSVQVCTAQWKSQFTLLGLEKGPKEGINAKTETVPCWHTESVYDE